MAGTTVWTRDILLIAWLNGSAVFMYSTPGLINRGYFSPIWRIDTIVVMPTEPIKEGDFSGGLNLTDAPIDLKPNEYLELLNVFLYGGPGKATLKYAGGNRAVHTATGPPQGFIKFRTSTDSFDIWAAGGNVYAYSYNSATVSVIHTGGHATNLFEFAVLSVYGHDRVFWVDGSSAVKQWYGTGTATSVGITAPVSAASVANGGSGNLDSTNNPPIQYAITYADTTKGVESNPSPFSVGIAVTASRINLTAIPVSADARVNARYIYRFGADLAVWTMVATLADNVTTVYTDNLADNLTGTIQLSFSRDTPPAACTLIAAWKHRLCLGGDPLAPFRWYYSSEDSPDYFPQGEITFPLTDGGFKDIDGDRENGMIGFSQSGSNFVIGRSKGIWWISGDTGDDFVTLQMCNPGVIARRSMVQCGNIGAWLAPDGNVYILTGEGQKRISESIRKFLEAIDKTRLPTACACYWRGRYVLCIGNADGSTPICLAYDFSIGGWVSLGNHTRAARQLYSDSGLGDLDEIWLTTEAGYTNSAGVPYTGIVATCTDDLTYLPVQIVSGKRDYGATGARIRIDGTRLSGDWTPQALTTPLVTYRAFSGDVTTEHEFAVPFVTSPLFDSRVPRSLAGNYVQWQVDGTIGEGEITAMELDVEIVKKKGRRRSA